MTDQRCIAMLRLGLSVVALAMLAPRGYGFDGYALIKEGLLHLTAFGGAAWLLSSAGRLALDRITIAGIAFFAVACLSTVLVAVNPWLALRSLALACSGVLLFETARALAARGHRDAIVRLVVFVATVAALPAALEALGVVPSLSMPSRGPGGTQGNRNFLAHALLLAAPLAIDRALLGTTRTRNVARAQLTLLSMMIALSRCRSAWLAAFCAVIAVLIAAPLLGGASLRRRTWLMPLVAIAAGLVLAIALAPRLSWTSKTPFRDTLSHLVDAEHGSGHARLVQYASTLRMTADHPTLGVGLGNWSVALPRYGSDTDARATAGRLATSDWLSVAAELGAIGLSIVLALAGLLVARCAYAISRRDLQALVPLCVLVIIAVLGTLDTPLHLPLTVALAACALGATLPAASATRAVALSPTLRRSGVATLLIIGTLASLRSAGELAALAIGRSDDEAALSRALRYDPGSYNLRFNLAQRCLVRGDCACAREHAVAAARLMPNLEEPRLVQERCR